MSKTMQEYECQCGYKLWSRCKPPKPGVFIFKAPLCPNCHRPVTKTTGKTIVLQRESDLMRRQP